MIFNNNKYETLVSIQTPDVHFRSLILDWFSHNSGGQTEMFIILCDSLIISVF